MTLYSFYVSCVYGLSATESCPDLAQAHMCHMHPEWTCWGWSANLNNHPGNMETGKVSTNASLVQLDKLSGATHLTHQCHRQQCGLWWTAQIDCLQQCKPDTNTILSAAACALGTVYVFIGSGRCCRAVGPPLMILLLYLVARDMFYCHFQLVSCGRCESQSVEIVNLHVMTINAIAE